MTQIKHSDHALLTEMDTLPGLLEQCLAGRKGAFDELRVGIRQCAHRWAALEPLDPAVLSATIAALLLQDLADRLKRRNLAGDHLLFRLTCTVLPPIIDQDVRFGLSCSSKALAS